MATEFVESSEIRALFAAQMSEMYRLEVPAYGDLVSLVEDINAEKLAQDPTLEDRLRVTGGLNRLNQERHGAIRLGSARELQLIRRFFAVLGMFAVGYYDLGPSGMPVHSTAFRPVDPAELSKNPFRVFTSLLETRAISDPSIRDDADAVLRQRQIFSNEASELLLRFEDRGGLTQTQVEEFVPALVDTFKWHEQAALTVD